MVMMESRHFKFMGFKIFEVFARITKEPFLSNTYFDSDTPTASILHTSVTANYRRPNVQLYIHASDG